MKIIAIEPTPSPNTMKIILNNKLEGGKRNNYTEDNLKNAPLFIKELLQIEGVKGVYHVSDFLALERNPRIDWQQILPRARAVFGEEAIVEGKAGEMSKEDSFGEVKVYLQMVAGIPMQIKLTNAEEEQRVGLPDRYKETAIEAAKVNNNIVLDREWVERGVRYGSMEEIGNQVLEEVLAAYDETRLQGLLARTTGSADDVEVKKERHTVTLEQMNDPDWKKRYAAFEKLDPTKADLPLLEKALHDEKASIRRLAVVYLGMIESNDVLPFLCEAVLHDPSITVRRTAGDCLSDIGDPAAIPTMILALKDKNKLVRWRAAMFLYEVGDHTAIEALREAQNDPEFEVAMQIKLALKRIEGGENAEGSVWKQMTETRTKEQDN